VQIFLTSSEFIWKGLVRADIPFLCDSNMELVSIANEYLRFIATVKGRTRSKRTWLTYGSQLYEYFSFLEANELSWNELDQSQVAAWRDSMLNRGCARTTVNQRLRGIHSFYKWALQCNKTHSIPFYKEDIWVSKPKSLFAHVDASGNRLDVNGLTLRTTEPIPMFLHMEKALSFLNSITSHSLKLMGYLALLTGMRRSEVVELDYRVPLRNPSE
jgi:site-specific recombinase XerD